MAKYYYDGEVLMKLRFPKDENETSIKFDIRTGIEAPSLDRAFSCLADYIRDDSHLEFNGTMYKEASDG